MKNFVAFTEYMNFMSVRKVFQTFTNLSKNHRAYSFARFYVVYFMIFFTVFDLARSKMKSEFSSYDGAMEETRSSIYLKSRTATVH